MTWAPAAVTSEVVSGPRSGSCWKRALPHLFCSRRRTSAAGSQPDAAIGHHAEQHRAPAGRRLAVVGAGAHRLDGGFGRRGAALHWHPGDRAGIRLGHDRAGVGCAPPGRGGGFSRPPAPFALLPATRRPAGPAAAGTPRGASGSRASISSASSGDRCAANMPAAHHFRVRRRVTSASDGPVGRAGDARGITWPGHYREHAVRPALYLRIVPSLLVAGSSVRGGLRAGATARARIPLAAGLTLVSTLQGAARDSGTPDDAAGQGDREDVIVVDHMGTDGVRYRWSYTGGEAGTTGQTGEASPGSFAPRISRRRPGSTSCSHPPTRSACPAPRPSRSRGLRLAELRSAGRTRLSYAEVDDGVGGLLGDLMQQPARGRGGVARGIGLGLGGNRVYYRGTLTLVSPEPVALPLLIDGRRTAVPVLHALGRFSLGERRIELDFFVVPDPEHPLLLKITGQGGTWQVLRVGPARRGCGCPDRAEPRASECRAEMPGVYFAFGAADVSAESAPALRRWPRSSGGIRPGRSPSRGTPTASARRRRTPRSRPAAPRPFAPAGDRLRRGRRTA